MTVLVSSSLVWAILSMISSTESRPASLITFTEAIKGGRGDGGGKGEGEKEVGQGRRKEERREKRRKEEGR